MNFTDRFLKCTDCAQDFVFTAGEQLFFFDKQFKNDPKRCKLCKAKRAGLRPADESGSIALPLSRTETRTECSSCGVETTVPFKPTQGRPVLCRSCFQLKRVSPAIAAAAALDSPADQIALEAQALEQALATTETRRTATGEGDGRTLVHMGALLEMPLRLPVFEPETEPVFACCAPTLS